MKTRAELKIVRMASAAAWEKWLAKNHAKSPGVWLRFFKKNSGVKTVTYSEALEAALCHGWIDAQADSFDADSYLHKFTPRRPKSIWSKRNTDHAERLIRAGRMRPAGQAAIDAAKQDGRWKAAYDSPKNAVVPADLIKRLSRNKKAREFFETLNRTNRYSIIWRLQTAKRPETRARRMKAIMEMLTAGKKFHP